MKVTVLGKYGPYPGENGGTSAYWVSGGGANILLDCGSGAIGRLSRYIPLAKLDAVVLSHLHYDHICDLLPLSYYLQQKGEPLDLVLPFAPADKFDLLAASESFNLIEAGSDISVKGLKISFSHADHTVPAYGIKVSDGNRSLFYSGDTRFCPEVADAARGCDLLLLDTGCPEGANAPHMKLSEAAFLAKALNTRAVAAHLCPGIKYASPCPQVTIAQEFAVYEV